MSAAPSVLDIPTHPSERRAWILFRLKANGLNFRKLAQANSCAPQSLHDAARGVPSARLERVLAKAIGVDELALFPEHYTPDGDRIPHVRARAKTDKSVSIYATAGASGNVKNTEAA